MADVLAAIREPHKPTGDFWLCCDGCDAEGFEAETPAWPCRTARLVYTADEIAAYELESRKQRAAAKAQREADPSPTASLIPQIWGERLVALVTASPLTQIILNREHP